MSRNAFTLTDVDVKSAGAGIVGVINAAETLTNVTVTSTAPADTAAATPLVTLNTVATIMLTNVKVLAEDRQTGIVIRQSSSVKADRVFSHAFGTVGGVGGYGMLLTGESAGSDQKPNMTLAHADLQGESYGLAVFAAVADVSNSLLGSDGEPVPMVTIGKDTRPAPFGPAAVASGAASTVDLGQGQEDDRQEPHADRPHPRNAGQAQLHRQEVPVQAGDGDRRVRRDAERQGAAQGQAAAQGPAAQARYRIAHHHGDGPQGQGAEGHRPVMRDRFAILDEWHPMSTS